MISTLERLVLIALGIAASACGTPSADMAESHRELRVTRGDLRPRFLLTGELQAVESLTIGVPRTTLFRVLIQWIADDGALVRKGEPLVEFDSTEFVGTVEDRRTAVVRAEREFDQKTSEVRVNVVRAETEVEKTRINLAKATLDASVPQELLSDHDHQSRELALERARADHEKALRNLQVQRDAGTNQIRVEQIELDRAQRDLEEANRAINELTVNAPRDGIFIIADLPWEGRKVDVGDTVWVGIEIGSMPRLDQMRVRSTLSDVDDGRIAVGMPVHCTLDAHPGLEVPGEITDVTTVAREAHGQSPRRVFDVTVSLARSIPDTMLPGMSVRIEVALEETKDALLVPRAALDLSGGTPRAKLAGGRWRRISIGPCSAQECVVEGGLEDGARLGFAGETS